MSDLSTEVHSFVQSPGFDITIHGDDLMTIINRGVIKVEKAARVEELEYMRGIIYQEDHVADMLTAIDKLIAELAGR